MKFGFIFQPPRFHADQVDESFKSGFHADGQLDGYCVRAQFFMDGVEAHIKIGAQFVHFLLGPATVALAIPLYTQLKRVKAMLVPVVVGLLAGSLTAAFSAIAIAKLLGASLPTQLSLAPKSVTTRIHDPAIRGFAIGVASHGIGTARAFQVSEQSGAFAALAMGLNGALTALLLPLLLSATRGLG